MSTAPCFCRARERYERSCAGTIAASASAAKHNQATRSVQEAKDDDLPEWDVVFDVGGRVGLLLSIECGGEVTLFLRDASATEEPVQIAWDDEAHWHPHVLRWVELDSICRRIARRSPDLAHPGIPLLLLFRFAVIASEADYAMAQASLRSAFRHLSLFTDAQIDKLLSRCDFRGANVEWVHDPSVGWTVHQEEPIPKKARDLYTLRSRDNTELPFGLWRVVEAQL